MPEPDYSEKIEFSKHGIRMAVMAPNGRVTHLDNWELDMFGGSLPSVGDHITTLWDPDRPEPAESYLVIERHWIGELKGDNCWWLLLQPAVPSPTHRRLFKVARDQSSETRARRWRQRRQPQADLRKLIEARQVADKLKQKSRTKKIDPE